MTRRFFSGTSVKQAVLRAAGHYSIDPDEVEFKELDKRHGFLRIRRKVVIEVDPESPRRSSSSAAATAAPKASAAPESPESQPAAPTPKVSEAPGAPEEPNIPKAAKAPAVLETEVPDVVAPTRQASARPPEARSDASARRGQRSRVGREDRKSQVDRKAAEKPSTGGLVGLPERLRPAKERYPAATGATALAAEMALKVALELLAMEAKADVRQGDGQLEIELETQDQARLLDDDGRILAALQHLVPRLIRGFIGEGVMCRLDCDNFHQIREEQLRNMAQRAADEVKREGRPRTLQPMPPEERRLVHLALESDSTVRTDSVGDGFFKRVRVRPV